MLVLGYSQCNPVVVSGWKFFCSRKLWSMYVHACFVNSRGFFFTSSSCNFQQICGCGLITIGIQLENYNYRDIGRFPLQSYYFTYSDETEYGAVIAPFWLKNEELSTRISTVGYEVHTSDGGEESANLLQRVSSFISNSSFLKSRTDSTETEPFSGTWMAVVHWDKLIPLIDTSYSSSYHYSDREVCSKFYSSALEKTKFQDWADILVAFFLDRILSDDSLLYMESTVINNVLLCVVMSADTTPFCAS